MLGDGGAAAAFREALPKARSFSRRSEWPPDVSDADLVVNATSERDEVLAELGPGQTLVDLPYPETATAKDARERGAHVVERPRGARRPGRGLIRALDRRAGACRGDAARRRLVVVTLELTTAGSRTAPRSSRFSPACPRASSSEQDRIDADLARRQQGYGRSPRQQLSRTASMCSRGFGTAEHSGRRSRSSSRTATTRTGSGG